MLIVSSSVFLSFVGLPILTLLQAQVCSLNPTKSVTPVPKKATLQQNAEVACALWFVSSGRFLESLIS